MSGQVGDLSPKQEAALKQFKENVKDVTKPDADDFYMVRWLRARNWDLKKSEKMIRENKEWRKKMDADNILKWDAPEVLKKYYPGGYFGKCKQGYPIWIDTLGTVDLKGLLYSVKTSDLIKFKTLQSEVFVKKIFPELSEKAGKRIDQCHLIFDMEGIGLRFLWKPAMDVFTEILSIFEANYPETLQTCYIVNAPSFFPIAYNMVKPFLQEHTRRKIRVLGKNWKECLLKDIDAEELPVKWGGTATDPDGDPCCKSKINMGGKIPTTYHMKNIQENIDMSNFTSSPVQRGSSLQLDYPVKEPGSMIRWQFWTDGKDIAFGLFRRTQDQKQKAGDMEALIPTDRVNSHMVPEEGSFACDLPGTYVIRFDNTYSWVNAKKVSYLVEVLPPDNEMEDLQITKL